MPDNVSGIDQNPNIPPPSGDASKAEKYVNQLISLIESDKLTITHTDLAKFDPSSLQDHFLMQLTDYQVEISHSKHPDSGKDIYTMLFTNLKKVADGSGQKVILAYMHLDDSQFMKFRRAYAQQVERRRKAEEERRLKEALAPVDQILEQLSSNSETALS